MAKLTKIKHTKGVYSFWCPGCNTRHFVNTENEGYDHPIWGFNEDVDKPTITPSIKVTMPNHTTMGVDDICHSFIRDGKIEYLSDCTHELAGKTIEMEHPEHG